MQTITYTHLQQLVQKLPEAQLPNAYRLLLGLLSQEKKPAALPADVIKLPLEERRQLLARQAEQLKTVYEQDAEARTAWQTGQFADDYQTR